MQEYALAHMSMILACRALQKRLEDMLDDPKQEDLFPSTYLMGVTDMGLAYLKLADGEMTADEAVSHLIERARNIEKGDI